MEDIEVLIARVQVAEKLKFSKLREYRFGLTSDDIYNLCNFEYLPQTVLEALQPQVQIQVLSSGMFGRAELVSYRGKQYVRKTQKIIIEPSISLLLNFPETYSPFENEIQMMQELSMHPVLFKYVPVYYGHAVAGADGTYLMEYLKGDTLLHLCQTRGMSPEEWEFVLGEITTILSELHNAGYVFNDVHSNNFFVRVEGNTIKSVVLIDFGLTKHLDKEKTSNYRRKKSLYNNAIAQGRRAYAPNLNRNIPEFNQHHFKIMKTELLELQGCAPKTPPVVLAIEAKPRDYELATPLTEEQIREFQSIDAEIGKLKLDIARLTQEVRPIQHISNLRQSIRNQRLRGLKSGLVEIGEGIRSIFTRRGGKRKHSKTRRR